jgi:hypothetical protein
MNNYTGHTKVLFLDLYSSMLNETQILCTLFMIVHIYTPKKVEASENLTSAVHFISPAVRFNTKEGRIPINSL